LVLLHSSIHKLINEIIGRGVVAIKELHDGDVQRLFVITEPYKLKQKMYHMSRTKGGRIPKNKSVTVSPSRKKVMLVGLARRFTVTCAIDFLSF
jgi:hypothetical protein